MTSRESFEAQIRKQFPTASDDLLIGRSSNGRYGSMVTEHAWLAWQAATAATQGRCAQAVEELDRKKWFPSQRDFAEACVDAIRKGE